VFVMWQIVSALQMELLTEILGAFVSVGFIALIIIFQPEIRQFLLALGTPRFIKKYQHRFSFLGFRFGEAVEVELEQILNACDAISRKKMGALIVITRNNDLLQYAQSGVILNADISQSLLENIFFKNSPLHDGAVLISHNKVTAAGCILPVTKKKDIPGRPGLRHRAALGISEQSDALAIVISEETGRISLAYDSELSYIGNIEALRRILSVELGREQQGLRG
jgi:diadenylate cyclase